MRATWSLNVFSFFMAITLIGSTSPAQDATDQLGSVQLGKWSKYYQQRAEQYKIHRTSDGQALTLKKKPVMRWTNLVVSDDKTHGECFVWTHKGRPEVFVSLFSYNSRQQRIVAHAFNSLSRQPLQAVSDKGVFWTPQTSGLDGMKPIPGAPKPDGTRLRRLSQMRRMSRRFSGRSGGSDGNKELELRLLTTPVYRYEVESTTTDEEKNADGTGVGRIVDGGLFAFVTGTDPEVLLLIEAREVEGKLAWYFLAAPHSHLTLRVKYNDQPVWESLRVDRRAAAGKDYTYRSQHGVDWQESILP